MSTDGFESLNVSRILIPIDSSPNSKRALNAGVKLVHMFDAALFLLNVMPINPHHDSFYEQQEREAKRLVEDASATARSLGVKKISSEVIRADNSIVQEIIDSAKRKDADLIVIGTRGAGGFIELLHGSISVGVVTHAHCNVMVIR